MSWSFSIGESSISLGALAGALLTLILIWVVALALRRRLNRYAEAREHSRRASLYTVAKLIYYTMIVIAVFAALGVLGIPVSRFAVFAGALGVGLGFGLQAIFNNFVSGLILLFDRSLKVGDFVELESGIHGEVKDINIRATLIRTNDNIDILVPNSEFVSGRVTNWTHNEVSRRIKLPFGVAYGSDKEKVKAAALEAAAAVPYTLTLDGRRAPQVWLNGFGDSSLDFALVVWLNADATRRPSRVRSAYNWALHDALEEHGLEIPFPQRDLRLRSAFGHESDAAIRDLFNEPGAGATSSDRPGQKEHHPASPPPPGNPNEAP
ncbi:MAG: mechanosensitive ion channel [Xanthomonadales bacterium]|nr:mechanosensitive ion channel [Xanthomonadales bacterium]